MKKVLTALILITTTVQFVFAVSKGNESKKENQKSSEYYDAEKIKVVKTYQLTTDGVYRDVKWSPNGDMLSAVKMSLGSTMDGLCIFKLEEGNKKAKKIGIIPEIQDYNYVWSPDGKKIAYTVVVNKHAGGIWIIDMEKEKLGNKKRITLECGRPTWSFDSKKIAFVDRNSKSLNIINSDGTDLKKIIEVTGEIEVDDPQFIDVNKIAYLKGSVEEETLESHQKLFMIDINSLSETQVLPDMISDFVWYVPKHKSAKAKILYNDARYREFLINEDGSNKISLLNDEFPEKSIEKDFREFLDFSPDGSKLLYMSGQYSPDDLLWSDISVMNVNGTEMKKLIDTPYFKEQWALWSPDGEWILYPGDNAQNLFLMKITRHHE